MDAHRPLRICLVSSAYRPYLSGVSEHVHDLAVQLRRRGHEVSLLTSRYPLPTRTLDPDYVSRVGRVLVIPHGRGHFTLPVGLLLPGQVRSFIRSRPFDVVHCHGIFPPEIAYWATLYAQVPVVATFHWSFEGTRLLRALFHRAFPRLNGRLAARIAVSNASHKWVRQWFPGDYHVIHNGVDTEKFRPGLPAPPSLSDRRPSVLFVGRLDERKGLPVLLRAMPAVLKELPSARLVAVGPGPLRECCERLSRRLGIDRAVVFEGPVESDRLPGYYGNCTVYVSPAMGRESMGIVLVEAMACGRPVIASDIAGYNEVIQPEINGILVPENDPAALAAAIVRVLKDAALRARLEAAAHERSQDMAWTRIAGRIEEVYREVLD